MLSVAPVSTGAASSGYYKSEGYYAKDSEEAKDASQWFGKGAEAFGLTGHVSEKTFDEVMQGFTPDDRQLGKEVDGERVHRAGTDLTFSAPKSVSIMGLVAGDRRVIEAHDNAVKTALAYVEQNFLETRIANAETGKMERVGGQKMIAGVFRHDTSRNLDPQLHSHAVVANMTIGEDGKWRTVENRAIFQNKMEIGAVYRSALAANLHEAGYDVVREGKHGFVEIRGVPEALKDAFSTRREEIRAALDKSSQDNPSAAVAARATLITRNAKTKDVDRAGLYGLWREEAAAKGFDRAAMDKVMSGAKERLVLAEDRALEARTAVDYAIAHISERLSVYGEKDLFKTAVARTRLSDSADVRREIDARVKAGELIHVVDPKAPGMMTDAKTILTERAVIAELNDARGAVQPIATQRQVDRALYGASLTDGQRASIELSLTSKDRVIGVQGYAGTGKTYMLSRARAIAEKNGYEMIGLAPSHRAVHELNEAGVEANTLQSFLARNEGLIAGRMSPEALDRMRKDYANKAIVVDESSMIATGQMRDLLHIANKIGAAKVILVGDTKQLDAVEAGSPFRALQNAGMETALMADIMRQRNPEMLAAVHSIIKGEVAAFFEKVGDRVVDVESPTQALADKWLALSEDGRRNTMLITQSNAWRDEINGAIREGLRAEGQVRGEDHAVARLDDLRLTAAQRGVAENYQANDVVIFEREIKSLGVAKGESFSVVSSDSAIVTLKAEADGREVAFEPGRSTWMARSVSVYERDRIELAEGDKVRFDRTDLDEGVVNKATGEITAISDREISFRLGADLVTLPRDHDLIRHLDYAWGSTVHGSQGATVENAYVAMDAASPLSTQKSAYVAASRMKEEVVLFTNGEAKLKSAIAANTGERLDARDVVPDDARAVRSERNAELDPREEAMRQVMSDDFARALKGVKTDDRSALPDAREEERDMRPTRDDDPRSPEAEDAWRAAAAAMMKDEKEVPNMRDDDLRATRDDGQTGDAAHGRAGDKLDDGERDDVRRIERAAHEDMADREPELPFDHGDDDRFVRDEMRHSPHAERGEDDHFRDAGRDAGKVVERGNDGEIER